jgi:tRNA (adenine37-N6)-methyltransferase
LVVENLNSFTQPSTVSELVVSSEQPIRMKPIGYVKTDAVGDEVKDKTRLSKIIIRPELVPALEGIAEYSHLYILFWLHAISEEKRMVLKVHPRGRADLPLLGIFSVRTNLRPNPIGLTLVEFVNVKENVLTVRGLDAFNDTPVLDIKPYDHWDKPKQAKVPNWWLKLEKEKGRA